MWVTPGWWNWSDTMASKAIGPRGRAGSSPAPGISSLRRREPRSATRSSSRNRARSSAVVRGSGARRAPLRRSGRGPTGPPRRSGGPPHRPARAGQGPAARAHPQARVRAGRAPGGDAHRAGARHQPGARAGGAAGPGVAALRRVRAVPRHLGARGDGRRAGRDVPDPSRARGGCGARRGQAPWRRRDGAGARARRDGRGCERARAGRARRPVPPHHRRGRPATPG